MSIFTLLGPIEIGGSDAWNAVGLHDDGRADAAVERTPEAAVETLLARAGGGAHRMDGRFREVAARLHLETASPPSELMRAAAELALHLLNPGSLGKITDAALLAELVEAIGAFSRLRPWRCFHPDAGHRALVTGVLGGERELSVLGSAGEQLGLVVYATPGATKRLQDATDEDRRALLTRLDWHAVLLDAEPPWALPVLEQGFGLPLVPIVNRLERGRPAPLRPDDVRLVVAALRAVVAVVKTGAAATGTCEARGKRAQVRLEPGATFDPAGGYGEAPGPRANPVHELDRLLSAKLVAFARERVEGFTEAWLEEGPLARQPALALPLGLFVRPFAGTTIARRALAAGLLDEAEARWIAAQESAWLTLLEVEAASPQEGTVAVRDLLTGERHVVHDVSVATNARLRDGALVRLAAVEGELLLLGNVIELLPPERTRSIREAFLRAEGRDRLDAAALREPARVLRLVGAVVGSAPPPAGTGDVPRNTDGDPLLFVDDTFELPGAARALRDALPALPQVSMDEEESRREASFTWTRPGNAMHRSWRCTVLGSFRAAGDRIVVSTNSEARAALARSLLTGALGPRLRFKGRKEHPLQVPPGVSAGDLRADAQPLRPGPWLRLEPELERLAELREELAAGSPGRAPSPAAVASVHAKLCEHEFLEARDAADALAQFDPDRTPLGLRRLIGISWDGELVGPDLWYGRLGAGVPLSLALPAIYVPLLAELPGPPAERTALALTVALWNLSRTPPVSPEAVQDACERLDGPGAQLLRREAPWLLDRALRLFPHDDRLVAESHLHEGERGARLEAKWTLPLPLQRAAMEALDVGPVPARPLLEYDPESPVDAGGWQLTPPVWRRELVAAAHRDLGEPFGADLAAHVARHVEVEEALLAGKPATLAPAVDELEDRLGSRHEALDVLVAALVAEPALSLRGRASKRLQEVLDAAVRGGRT